MAACCHVNSPRNPYRAGLFYRIQSAHTGAVDLRFAELLPLLAAPDSNLKRSEIVFAGV